MNTGQPEKRDDDWNELTRNVETLERRKLKARREKFQSVWFGMGMFGVVGWSIAIPAIAGIFLGLWLDTEYPGTISWTLTLLFAGTVMGCLNAWFWIKQQAGKEHWKKER